jgi:hypothetical protein
MPFGLGQVASRTAGCLALAGAMSCGGTSAGPDIGSREPGTSSESLGGAAPTLATASVTGQIGRYQAVRQLILDTSTGLRWQRWSEPGRYDWLLASAVCHQKGMRLPKVAELRALRSPGLAGAVCGLDSTLFLGERCVTLQTQEGLAFSSMAGDVVPVVGQLSVRCVE